MFFLPPRTENIVACEAPKASKFTVLFAPNAFRNWLNTLKMTPRGALRASPPSSTTVTTASDFAVVTHFAPIWFYKQTTFRTEAFTQSSFCAQILLYKEVCAQFLHTDAFTHGGFYATKSLHKCFNTPMLCTKMLKHAGAFTHTFYIEKPLHRTALHNETVTQKNFDAEKLLHTDCAKKLLHTETFITRRNVSAQKPLRTEVFTHNSFCTQTFLHTDAFTQKNF